MYLFSASTGGFYHLDIHDPASLPADVRPVSAETHAALMEAQAQGKRIIADAIGDPVAADPAPRTTEQELLYLRSRRDRLLMESDRTQIADFPLSAPDRAAWAEYRATLRTLPETFAADPASAVWPEPPTPGVLS